MEKNVENETETSDLQGLRGILYGVPRTRALGYIMQNGR